MEYESRKIALPKEAKELESFPVRRYHIDTNEHVNNCQYVQMALESLPKKIKKCTRCVWNIRNQRYMVM